MNLVSDPAFEFDVHKRVPSVEKAKRVLGFDAATTLEEMLDEVIPGSRRPSPTAPSETSPSVTSVVAVRRAAGTTPVPDSRNAPVVERVAIVAHVASLVLGGLLLLYVARTQWFFGDDWEFVVTRGLDHPMYGLLHPHNEHWSTLPILVYRGLVNLVGVRTYVPFLAVLVALHLALAHLLWRSCLRVGASMMVATALTAAFVVLGAAENLLWAFQMGFVGSVLFGVLAVLAADVTHQSRAGLAATWVLGVLALMCSGIGVVMVAVAAITAFLRRGLRAALLLALVPAVVFTAWYAVYGKSAASPTPRSIGTLLAIPEYTAIGLTSALTNFVGIPAMGTIIAVALAAWLLRSGRTAGTSRAIAFAGSCGAIALFVFIGVGRSGFGVEEAAAARYAYIAIGLLLPALALLASWAAAATPWPTMVTVFVGVVLCMHNLSDLRAAVATERAREGVIRSHVLAAADIVASEEPVLRQQPDPSLNPDITMEALARFREQGWLPVDVGTFDAKDTLDVRAQVQVALTPETGSELLPATVVHVAAARPRQATRAG